MIPVIAGMNKEDKPNVEKMAPNSAPVQPLALKQ
jgi:hypothetical protein